MTPAGRAAEKWVRDYVCSCDVEEGDACEECVNRSDPRMSFEAGVKFAVEYAGAQPIHLMGTELHARLQALLEEEK